MRKNVFFIYLGIILLIAIIIIISFPRFFASKSLDKVIVIKNETTKDDKVSDNKKEPVNNKKCYFRGTIGDGNTRYVVFEYSGETSMLSPGDIIFDYRIEKITEKQVFLFNVRTKKNKIRLEIGESFDL